MKASIRYSVSVLAVAVTLAGMGCERKQRSLANKKDGLVDISTTATSEGKTGPVIVKEEKPTRTSLEADRATLIKSFAGDLMVKGIIQTVDSTSPKRPVFTQIESSALFARIDMKKSPNMPSLGLNKESEIANLDAALKASTSKETDVTKKRKEIQAQFEKNLSAQAALLGQMIDKYDAKAVEGVENADIQAEVTRLKTVRTALIEVVNGMDAKSIAVDWIKSEATPPNPVPNPVPVPVPATAALVEIKHMTCISKDSRLTLNLSFAAKLATDKTAEKISSVLEDSESGSPVEAEVDFTPAGESNLSDTYAVTTGTSPFILSTGIVAADKTNATITLGSEKDAPVPSNCTITIPTPVK